MKTPENTLNEKLKHLVSEGLSVEDAAECLGLDIDSAKLALKANDISSNLEDTDNVDEILRISKPKALKALINIGLNSKIENVSARVAALSAIAKYDDKDTSIEKDKINEIYRKMRAVSEKYDKELADSKISKINNINPTTLVIVNDTSTVTTPGVNSKVDDELVAI